MFINLHAGVHDDKGDPKIKDHYGSPLTASGNTQDDMLLVKLECVYTGSANHGSSMLGPVVGAIFTDYGSDLGSGPTLPVIQLEQDQKPGSGNGYGFGIRVDSPLGPLRLEYAFNDSQEKRFHFGVDRRK
ncbi:PREDICTED: outer envelope protein 80, chloroplastic-like isoform X1 [Nelumbo nucifera]|uniref:Outer envelope protein 80, chloroplastic-like isoform X1 n=1 Tax=Nelumbo nucifera TaxID=4432 RepID=A0A1U8PZL8_NELNU|nr:PREDICTED: outer envelope protein 80, chloroplastic-like isoform X1 [Nelumbo nucifera]XP_019051987.1 PREDICTED: outer envelope protein 80, chloroplastic-like isoform X1 [Nelumbo nucifera]XP_019051988.1 PREDICTED: outer envelope protein 80, chloroplastic-like isoform X1 [Nelumbo nucifera]